MCIVDCEISFFHLVYTIHEFKILIIARFSKSINNKKNLFWCFHHHFFSLHQVDALNGKIQLALVVIQEQNLI